MDVNESVLLMKRFTDTYLRYRSSNKYTCELQCLRQQFPAVMLDPMEGDLFVGRYDLQPIGFTPQEYSTQGGLGYYMNWDKINRIKENTDLTAENAHIIDDLIEYWKEENTAYKVRSAYSQEMKRALPSDRWTEDSGVAFPLYRMAGAMLNYKTLLNLGIGGLRECLIRYQQEKGDSAFYQASVGALDLFREICIWYAERLNNGVCGLVPDRMEMADTLKHIADNKPQTFRQAIQLVFLYNSVSGTLNYGRMDDYLAPFFKNDLDNGTITEGDAAKLLESLWKLMVARDTPTDGRVIIGGRGRKYTEAADRFALLAIETSMKVKDVLPQLTLRFHEGQNPDLMDRALQSIADGNTFPLLYNDDVNIEAVMKAFDIPAEEAEQYTPYGCGEYVIDGKSFGTPSGVINLLKALEVTLFNGFDPVRGRDHGIKNKSFKEYTSFDALFSAYKKQVDHFLRHLAEQEMMEYRIAGQEAPFLFMSMLYDDCLERGKPLFDGGVRYLGGTVETYGNTNASDSLFAIKKHVFEHKRISPDQLLKMIKQNFDCYDEAQRVLLETPKYGNDDEEADDMYLQVHRHVCGSALSLAKGVGLHSYLVVNINNSANTILGRKTMASADGRKAFTPMANGNAASPGMDTSGITAYLNSISRPDPDIHAGCVQNLKLSPGLFREHFDKLKALLRTWFKRGGTQLMINVVKKEDLLRALDHPEEFPNLIVRVGGFSARFIELDRDVQLEIINRTSY